MLKKLIIFSSLLTIFSLHAETIKLESTTVVPTFVELYTSQGCSSCPPADKLLNSFKKDKNLFTEIIPIAFHVDYWDRLGWKDPFASKENTSRQRQYYETDNTGQVYTPQFVVNGKEWRGFFKNKKIQKNRSKAEVLSVEFDGKTIKANYPIDAESNKTYDLHVSILGIGLETSVKRGENHGKTLAQDFVALTHDVNPSTDGTWSFKLNTEKLDADQYALVAWVSKTNNATPIQAVASYIVGSTK